MAMAIGEITGDFYGKTHSINWVLLVLITITSYNWYNSGHDCSLIPVDEGHSQPLPKW